MVFVDDDAKVVIGFVVLGYGPGLRLLAGDHWLASLFFPLRLVCITHGDEFRRPLGLADSFPFGSVEHTPEPGIINSVTAEKISLRVLN